MDNSKLWILNAETASLFFERCMQREAITEPERIQILDEMKNEWLIDCVDVEDISKTVKMLKDNANVLDMRQTVADGHGSTISQYCPTCKHRSMQVVRPGKFQCSRCG